MIDKKSINYDYINNLYYKWINERDSNRKRSLKEEIKRIGTHDFLIYSYLSHLWPFDAFRAIFSLDDLFSTIETMKTQGEDTSKLTHQILLVETPEDIQSVNRLVNRKFLPEIANFNFIFNGENIFKYGDYKNIGKKIPIAHVNGLTIEQVEEMIKSKKDYKGIPILITIDNMGQLPIEKLEKIERYFDVGGVRIQERKREGRTTQGETRPLTTRSYKQVQSNIDDIIRGLYVNENNDKMQEDFQIATQVIDAIAQRVEYDYDAADKPRGSNEVRDASGMAGLLTGKSICLGYSEILRNVFSCVGIESQVIEGTDMQGSEHAWNQVRLGDKWFNVDLTNATQAIREGKTPGDLFMSDQAFFGERKKTTFKKGNFESTVYIGGHSPNRQDSNHRKCEGFIPPYITAKVLEDSRHYDEKYKREGKNPDYKGPVPYRRANVEKQQSKNNNIRTTKIPVDI